MQYLSKTHSPANAVFQNKKQLADDVGIIFEDACCRTAFTLESTRTKQSAFGIVAAKE